MAWTPTGHGLLRRISPPGMLLAPFLGIPYNPRVLNRQLPLECVSVFILRFREICRGGWKPMIRKWILTGAGLMWIVLGAGAGAGRLLAAPQDAQQKPASTMA